MKKQKRRKLQRELQREIYCNSCTPNLSYRDIFTMNCISRGKSFNQSDFDNYILSDDAKSLKAKYNMKEKNCYGCKSLMFPRKCLDVLYDTRGCSKNNLFINNPQTHSCDMYEENVETLNIIIRNVKLNGSMIEITLFDLDNEKDICTLLAPRGNANKFIVGEQFKYNR